MHGSREVAADTTETRPLLTRTAPPCHRSRRHPERFRLWKEGLNLSSDFNVLVDLIARERARCLISQCKITAKQALAIYRQFVSRRIGLIACRGWAQHITNRFRDAVSTDPTPSPVADAEFFAEADFSRNSRRGGYYGRSVPGA